jgi:hypothetical protein
MTDPHDRFKTKATQPLVLDLDELLADLTTRPPREEQPEHGSGPLVAEVIDTHHPHRPGRILVSWTSDDGEDREAWLHTTTQVRPRTGDRVLLLRPTNYCECIVTAVLSRDPVPPQPADGQAVGRVALQPSESLRVEASDGTPLVEIASSEHGPVVRVLSRDLELAVPGRLRLSADTIECVSGQGGTDLRSDGETVVRAPRIRLN